MPIRVSIVEDDSQVRQLLTDWVRHAEDIEMVRAYPDAERAVEDLPLRRADVVLTDIHLPGMSGIECVRQLKAMMPATNFVMLTVYIDAERIFQALAAGATGYLLKRASREELLAAIREVHEGGSPMSSSIARLVCEAFRAMPPRDDALDQLTERELDVLRLLARGMLYKEISNELAVSFNTVHTLVRRIYDKLQVHTRRQAVDHFQRRVRPLPTKPRRV
jgi:DNA-binding NarL/FixJ family response regulator